MFTADPERHLHWFRPSRLDMEVEFELVGVVIGAWVSGWTGVWVNALWAGAGRGRWVDMEVEFELVGVVIGAWVSTCKGVPPFHSVPQVWPSAAAASVTHGTSSDTTLK